MISINLNTEYFVRDLGKHNLKVASTFYTKDGTAFKSYGDQPSPLIFIHGVNEDLGVVETIEIPDHPWFVSGQFHPELKSRVNKAHPLFREFIKAGVKNKI